LLIFLFNVGGYYLVFWGLRINNDKLTWDRIENSDYAESETMTIKMPMALPYPVYESGYHEMHDKFEHNGEFFKGIKQKLEGDTLFIVCVKDMREKRLVNTMTKYAKESSDLPTHEKNHASIGKLLKEYESLTSINVIHNTGWCYTQFNIENISKTISRNSPILVPPPEV
jgi:hypothetical protein